MDYTTLNNQIKAYCEESFPSTVGNVTSDDQVAIFIKNAEQKIYNAVQLPSLRKATTLTSVIGDPYVDAPTDFLASFSLAVIDGARFHYLLNKDVNFIRECYPYPAITGLPQYYAIYGLDDLSETELKLIIGPSPDSAYSLALNYFFYPESIVTAGNTWLGDNFDTALLYGCLIEADIYMKGEKEVESKYRTQYNEAMQLLKQLGDGKDRQDSYRSGQVRVPVT